MNWELYDVNEKIDYLLTKYLDPATGEIADEAVKQIEELGLQRSDLIKNLALAVKRNDVYIAGMKEEVKRIQSRIAQAEKSSYWLTQQVKNNITEGEIIKDPMYEVKWTTSTKLVVDEFDRNAEKDYEDKTYKKFIKKKVVTTFDFDKPAIKKFISDTANKLNGFSISKTKNLKIK
jgi:seryl-tRNA synthetase